MGTEQHSATHGAYRALVGGAGAARGATGDDAQQRELTARLPAPAHAAAASSATLAQEEQTGGGDGRTAVRAGAAQTGGTCSAGVARMENGANGADCVDIVAAELACVRLDDGAEAARNMRVAAAFAPPCVQAPPPAAGAQTRLSSDLHPRLNQRLLGCGHQDDRSEVEPRKEASSGGIPAAGAGAGNVLKTAAILPAVQDDLAGRRTCCPRGVIQRTITVTLIERGQLDFSMRLTCWCRVRALGAEGAGRVRAAEAAGRAPRADEPAGHWPTREDSTARKRAVENPALWRRLSRPPMADNGPRGGARSGCARHDLAAGPGLGPRRLPRGAARDAQLRASGGSGLRWLPRAPPNVLRQQWSRSGL